MELSPLRSAALGLALVALATLTVSQSAWIADRLVRRFGLRPGLRERCRGYSLALLGGAIAVAVLSAVSR